MDKPCEVAAELFENCKTALDIYRDAVHALAQAELERREREAAMNGARVVWEERRSKLEEHQFEHGCPPLLSSTPESA